MRDLLLFGSMSKEPSNRARLFASASTDALDRGIELGSPLGKHTQRLAEEKAPELDVIERQQYIKQIALYVLETLIENRQFKDIRIPEQWQQFNVPADVIESLQGNDGRALYIKREQLRDLPPDFPEETIAEAMSYLTAAIKLAATKNYEYFAHIQSCSITNNDTERFGQDEYVLAFPFDMLVGNTEIKDDGPLTELDNFDQLILDKLTQWSDPIENPRITDAVAELYEGIDPEVDDLEDTKEPAIEATDSVIGDAIDLAFKLVGKNSSVAISGSGHKH
jgi:hypothetical protein